MKLVSGEPNEINQSKNIWTPPINWTGPCAVLYQSFDSSYGFVLMEGTQAAAMNCVPLVSGKVSYISIFQKNNQLELKSKIKSQSTSWLSGPKSQNQ